MDGQQLREMLARNREFFHAVSGQIWDYAETRFREKRSCRLQREAMEAHGFSITASLGGIPTAFMAQWFQGEGGPVIAFLGEYDALPGLSQEEGVPEHRERAPGAPGHGCGHNLLGAAAMAAAAAVKEQMEARGLAGTVRYYGCPGEENGAGKAFLVREGCFDGVDLCFSWHPFDFNSCGYTTLANVRVFFTFKGVSAHAAAAPQLGRSALEAVELLNIGVSFLREHLPQEARVHYAITDAGGDAANIIQANAQVLYAIRAPKTEQVGEILRRIRLVAEGAALMTETQVETRVVSAYADVLPNPPLERLLHRRLAEALPLHLTKEERAEAEAFAATLSPEAVALRRAASARQGGQDPLVEEVIEPMGPLSISTDVGDVSWVVPTAALSVACYPMGTASHTWQVTAQGKSPLALKGMDAAAYALAASALDALEDPGVLTAAREAHRAARDGREYHTLIPPEVMPGSF